MSQQNNTLITIAIPFFNAEQFLAKAIDSVLWQSYTNWNLILLDDGSTDNSLKIAKDFANRDSRIKVISDGQNKNLGFRLNQIPSLVDTIYLARMDADDIMHPERLKKQIDILLKNPDIDVLGTNVYTINEFDDVIGMRYKYDNNNSLQEVSGFVHPTIMAKTEWFLKNKYDVQAVRVEDIELWYRTKDSCKFMILTEPLFFYREFGLDYYKKYFKANDSKTYILEKYKNDKFWINFFKSNKLKGFIYYIFNLVNKENILIKRRNQIIFKDLKKSETYF